jgi:hypothetical protein
VGKYTLPYKEATFCDHLVPMFTLVNYIFEVKTPIMSETHFFAYYTSSSNTSKLMEINVQKKELKIGI